MAPFAAVIRFTIVLAILVPGVVTPRASQADSAVMAPRRLLSRVVGAPFVPRAAASPAA